MQEILELFVLEHPKHGYQPGMQILLKVIMEVLKCDSHMDISDSTDDEATLSQKKLFMEIHDPHYVCADAYQVFSRIMNVTCNKAKVPSLLKLIDPTLNTHLT